MINTPHDIEEKIDFEQRLSHIEGRLARLEKWVFSDTKDECPKEDTKKETT